MENTLVELVYYRSTRRVEYPFFLYNSLSYFGLSNAFYLYHFSSLSFFEVGYWFRETRQLCRDAGYE